MELVELRLKRLPVGADAGVSEAATNRNPLWNARRFGYRLPEIIQHAI